MSVRAKMKCQSVVSKMDGTEFEVRLEPVTGGSPENDSFYKYTPGGQVVLSTINKEAAKEFEEGKEYYVDFSQAH